jgi:hypothetical protein
MKKMMDDNNVIIKKHTKKCDVYIIKMEKLKEMLINKKQYDEDIY